MNAERQPGGAYQRLLFEESRETSRHGEGGTQAAACEESPAFTALAPTRALTERLMEEVTQLVNLIDRYVQLQH